MSYTVPIAALTLGADPAPTDAVGPWYTHPQASLAKFWNTSTTNKLIVAGVAALALYGVSRLFSGGKTATPNRRRYRRNVRTVDIISEKQLSYRDKDLLRHLGIKHLRSGNIQDLNKSDLWFIAREAPVLLGEREGRGLAVRAGRELKARSFRRNIRNALGMGSRHTYDSLVGDKSLLPRPLSMRYVRELKRGIGRGTRIAVLKSESTVPRGWSYGNYTVLSITPPHSSESIRAAVTLHVAQGQEVSGNVSMDAPYGTFTVPRATDPNVVIGWLMSELSGILRRATPNGSGQDLGRLGLRMHQWHSGMWDPIYMVGSYFVSGKRYPDSDVVDRALTEVERLERQTSKPSHKRELRSIAAGLRRYLRDESKATPNQRRHRMNKQGASAERRVLELLIWQRTHRDYRSMVDGCRSVMLPPSMGGGLACLRSLSASDLAALGRSMGVQVEGLR